MLSKIFITFLVNFNKLFKYYFKSKLNDKKIDNKLDYLIINNKNSNHFSRIENISIL